MEELERERVRSPRGPKKADLMELPTVSLVVLATLASVFALGWLQSVLVPLTLAIGFAQLFQPVVCLLSRLPSNLVKFFARCLWRRPPSPAPDSGSVTEAHGISLPGADSRGFLDGSSSPTSSAISEELTVWGPGNRRHAFCRRLQVFAQGLWDIIAVLICTLGLVGIVTFFVWCMVQAFEDFDYSKYTNSPKVDSIKEWLKRHGVDISKMDWSSIWATFRGQLLDTLNAMISFTEGIVLTSLMFFFCLYALVPSPHQKRRRTKGIKHLMQRYLLWKTISSAVIGCAVGFCLAIMGVDLAFVFGILTFVLNFIPNVGAAIAELLPVPLVLLDPDKTLSEAVFVFVVPFIIHNVLGCIMENKMMQHGLDLHPLIVVVALTFWSAVWGVAGAVLSVPLTSVIRLWLEEVDNPYARAAFMLISGPQAKPPKQVEARQAEAASGDKFWNSRCKGSDLMVVFLASLKGASFHAHLLPAS
ncbi:unnamed protein product [Effrenium voratum]|nr:unnamed protein product [Effrenium voratum]CAJ1442116.1 unnamed protein product [Effrenium voratum]